MLNDTPEITSPMLDFVKKEIEESEQEEDEEEEQEEEEADPMFAVTEPQFPNIIQHLEIEAVDDDIVKKQ